MNQINSDLNKSRKAWFDAINDREYDKSRLLQKLQQEKENNSELFVEYVADESIEAIDTDSSEWTEKYFIQQKKFAELNFSERRLDHLISVREHIRQQNCKDFSPRSRRNESSDRQVATSAYRPTDNFNNIVAEKDVRAVRTFLRMELNDIRIDSQTLRDALSWVKLSLPNLFEAYVEKAFAGAIDQDCNNWTVEYYSTQKVYLKANFAETRFLHLIDVRQHLRKQDIDVNVVRSTPEQKNVSNPSIASVDTQLSEEVSSVSHTSDSGLSLILKAVLVVGALSALTILLLVGRRS
jgi:hypothetical protein